MRFQNLSKGFFLSTEILFVDLPDFKVKPFFRKLVHMFLGHTVHFTEAKITDSHLSDQKKSPLLGESSQVTFSRMVKYSSLTFLHFFRATAKSYRE